MGLIGRYVAFGLMALVAAASLSLPVSVQAAQKSVKKKVVASKTLPARQSKRVVRRAAPPAPPSLGHAAGLQATEDELDLKSSVALVLDQDTDEVLFSKNSSAVLPIASITKLMTAVVVSDAALAPDEMLSVSQDDVDTEKGSRSRLRVGTQLSRIEMMHLALMASENRAAHALGRHYPGGLPAFIVAMNQKARALGMKDTHYVEPTGLSSSNRSSARDLATLVKAAYQYPLIRELSTSPEYSVAVGKRQLQFRNTNGLVRSPSWDIGLQKTGYISEAGRCLVMQAKFAGRQLIMVFLDSAGKYSRLGDAERVRRWVSELAPSVPVTRIAPIAAPLTPAAVPPAPVITPATPVVPMAPAAAATATLSTAELVATPES